MSEQWLFRAEADQIQETLFRGSRLRQVIGGSRLIAEFGKHAEALAAEFGAGEDDLLITAGGSFSIVFPTKKDAESFGEELATRYRRVLDASLTVAGEAVSLAGDFKSVNETAQKQLQHRKKAQRGQRASAQAPTTAFCQYSGAALAGKLLPSQDDPDNLRRCDYVATAVDLMREAGLKTRDTGEDSFLGSIAQHLPDGLPENWPRDVKDIAKLDSGHRNVAYLLADANGMGKRFEECTSKEQLRALSKALEVAMRQAVAAPVADLACYLSASDKEATLPILPLILAGDDVFILLPANYALDYAQRFCRAFEEAMRKQLNESDLLKPLLPHSPTMGAAVVICKESYPYRLAHQAGVSRLSEAKRLAKTLAHETNGTERLSAISFEMITGNELVKREPEIASQYRAEMRPYWASEQISAQAMKKALPIARLLEQRFLLKDTAGKRLAEFRELYAPTNLPEDAEKLSNNWLPLLKRLLGRIEATETSPGLPAAWRQALRKLGDEQDKEAPAHWLRLDAYTDTGAQVYFTHGLPDLIEMWDYAQTLDKPLEAYEKEER